MPKRTYLQFALQHDVADKINSWQLSIPAPPRESLPPKTPAHHEHSQMLMNIIDAQKHEIQQLKKRIHALAEVIALHNKPKVDTPQVNTVMRKIIETMNPNEKMDIMHEIILRQQDKISDQDNKIQMQKSEILGNKTVVKK